MPIAKHERIVVVGGAGTFGAALALALARRGFTNVVALDAHAPPSAVSAGNDLNKILGSDTLNPFYAQMAQAITHAWRTDPVYRPFWHPVGRLKAVDGPDDPDAAELRAMAERMARDPFYGGTARLLPRAPAIRAAVPHLAWLGSHIDGWYALLNGAEGWVHARGALEAAAREAQRLGVAYVTGAAGTVTAIEPAAAGCSADISNTCLLRTADGRRALEAHVVLCAGAWAPGLVDLKRQVVAKCWTVGHLQLTPEEAAPLKGMPVIHHPVRGFFFEPSEDNRIKICNEFPGYTHWNGHVSQPCETKFAVPEVCFVEIRKMVRDLLPRFADKPIVDACICWCTDTSDEEMLFDFHPSYHGALMVASGDCGNGFHRMPLIGEKIADALLGSLPNEEHQRWRWRPEVVPQDPNKFAPWRPGHSQEIETMPGWPMTHDPTLSQPSGAK